METADQSLSKREDVVATLQTEIRDLEGTSNSDEIVPETPKRKSDNNSLSTPLDKLRHSISSLDFSITKKSSGVYSSKSEKFLKQEGNNYHQDSSGVVADLDSDDSDSEISFKRNEEHCKLYPESSHLRLKPASPKDQLSMEYSGSDTSDIPTSPVINKQAHSVNETAGFNFKEAAKSTLDSRFHFCKPLNDSRVLQVTLSPLKNKVIVKHTKSSMLRLKNSPVKDPTRGRECMKNSPLVKPTLSFAGKENKRKCEDEIEVKQDDLNTSKRRKVEAKKKATKTKPVSSNRTGQKYNLRARR